MMRSKLVVAVMLGCAGPLAWSPEIVQAQGAWLDESVSASWNEPGMPIPAAPAREDGSANSRCRKAARPPQSPEGRGVVDRGWDLFGERDERGGMVVLMGAANYDGMCRPWDYQVFVFVGGTFAGTLSPQVMDSRTDGALQQVSIRGSDELIAQYARYTDADPLCCPSRTTSVQFEVETTQDGPVVRPVGTSTSSAR